MMASLGEENALYIILRNTAGGRRLKDIRTFFSSFKEENNHEEMLGEFLSCRCSQNEQFEAEGYIP